jgi:class 3 adenylate cyclase
VSVDEGSRAEPASTLPEGVVTFLFTDVEGSTRLATALGDKAWADLLEIHRGLLRAECSTRGGVEFGAEGDACFVVFSRASDAPRITFLAKPGWCAPRRDMRSTATTAHRSAPH